MRQDGSGIYRAARAVRDRCLASWSASHLTRCSKNQRCERGGIGEEPAGRRNCSGALVGELVELRCSADPLKRGMSQATPELRFVGGSVSH